MKFNKSKLETIQQALGYAMMNTRNEIEETQFALLQIEIAEFIEPNPLHWVSPRLGSNWKENAIKNYDKETLAELAFDKGRKLMILEKKLEALLN